MTRILLVKTSSLGDVVHNLPVVNDLLKHYPNATIDWVVEEGFSAIPALHPAVNNVIKVAVRRWRKKLFTSETWQEMNHYRKLVRQQRYDMVIDTQGLLKSGVLQSFARGPKAGYDFYSAREKLASFFYQRNYFVSKSKHAVQRNRKLAAKALGYRMPDTLPDYGLSLSQASKFDLPANFIMGLHGTSKDSKLWPTQHWVALAHKLAGEGYGLVLPWGNAKEEMRANQIAAQSDQCIVLPQCGIKAIAQVIAQSAGAVGVDTGLSHLATALGKPTVAIYTDTQPSRTGVLAGQSANAVNLGGVGQTPEVDEVMESLIQLTE